VKVDPIRATVVEGLPPVKGAPTVSGLHENTTNPTMHAVKTRLLEVWRAIVKRTSMR
jgi:hypothetical protein